MTALLRAAVERGVTFFDTAEVYGPLLPIPRTTKLNRLEENIGACFCVPTFRYLHAPVSGHIPDAGIAGSRFIE